MENDVLRFYYVSFVFVYRAALNSVYEKLFCMSPEQIESREKLHRVIMTFVWFATSLFLAVVVPNIGAVISLLGGLAAVFIFIFPGM